MRVATFSPLLRDEEHSDATPLSSFATAGERQQEGRAQLWGRDQELGALHRG